MAIYQMGPFAMDESFIYTFFPLLAAVLLLIYIKSKEANEAAKVQEAPSTYSLWDPDRKTTQATTPSFLQEPITPLDVDILSTPPHPFRPYKPIYHMTMGLEKCAPNDLFLIDSSYPSRIALRKQIVNAFPHTSLGASERCSPAIKDTFNGEFKNHVSGDSYPLLPPQNSIEALKILATTVEEDILILQKESGKETYSLQGFIACFPNGFDSSKKMGMELREIHGPVPMFKEKLANSMDRFFGRLEVGRWVRRLNWTISTHEKLFLPTGNHHYEGEDLPEELESVDLEKTYLRVERQVLLRLPVSRDIVFFVRTYMTPLARIKAEGQGEALATAIDGFPERLGVYKRRIVWGRAVQEALRA
ncbi:hypothetical protein TWF970_004599 [Orbilia oligospora]|uniref:Uncharacterized protein n=1 Tax=Orbilia oligospora TaxID=2813651 RepID=A0A7C8VGS2_ORBOL|nr:hypothetical protein TWF970_004599 [Orbilia oligospora]